MSKFTETKTITTKPMTEREVLLKTIQMWKVLAKDGGGMDRKEEVYRELGGKDEDESGNFCFLCDRYDMDCDRCPLIETHGESCLDLAYGKWVDNTTKASRKLQASLFLVELYEALQELKPEDGVKEPEVAYKDITQELNDRDVLMCSSCCHAFEYPSTRKPDECPECGDDKDDMLWIC